MLAKSASIAVLGAVTLLSLSGCGSGGGSPKAGGSTGGSGVTSVCGVQHPGASGAALPTVDVGKGEATVGVVLAGTSGATRSSDTDAELLTQALEDGGVTADVVNARGDRQRFLDAAQRMLQAGVKVLIVGATDTASGITVEQEADLVGAQVIDYDRLTPGGTAHFYVSYDAEDTGRLQAQTMIDCLAQQGVTDPRVLIMNGATAVDNNAVLLDKGAHEVLDPLAAAGRVTIEGESSVRGWRSALAGPTFKVALDAADQQVDGVLAANDVIADAVIGVLTEEQLGGHVVVAGQGPGTEGLRNVVTGQQSMTVYQDPRAQAAAAARLAIALVSGRRPSAAGFDLVSFADPATPGRTVKALLLPGQVITQANVKDVVASGALTTAEICAGITDPCAAVGLH